MITNQLAPLPPRKVLQLLRFHMIIGELDHMIRVADCRQNKKLGTR